MPSLPRRPFLQIHQAISGRRILHRLDQLNQSQWCSLDQLRDLQLRKLHRLLTHAAGSVPYYRDLFQKAGFSPDQLRTEPEALRRIPLLTKKLVLDNAARLCSSKVVRRRTRLLQTSGSTGVPLSFHQDNHCRDFVTAENLRHLGWAGCRLGDHCAFLLGARAHEPDKASLRTRLMDWVLNRFVADANTLSTAQLAAFTDQVVRRRPGFLFAYPWSATRFAGFVRDTGLQRIRFQAVILGGELLPPFQRQAIEETFGCRVFDRYGASETGGLACECRAHQGLHVSMENVYFEILAGDRPAEPDESGDVVVTSLNNRATPFIRYRLEDVAAWRPPAPCPCGRHHPMIEAVRGRRIDLLRRRDGQVAWGGLDRCLGRVEGLHRFQVVQKTFDHLVVRLVMSHPLSAVDRQGIEAAARKALGPRAAVTLEFPEEIEPEPSGKYRYQICEIR